MMEAQISPASASVRHPFEALDTALVGSLLRPKLEAAYGCWERSGSTAHNAEEWYRILVAAIQKEATSLDDMVVLSAFALTDQVTMLTPDAQEALGGEWMREVLERCRDTLSQEGLATPEAANLYFQGLRHYFRDHRGLRGRQVMYPIRAALTGTMIGPCLGIIGSLLGPERCRRRLEDRLL